MLQYAGQVCILVLAELYEYCSVACIPSFRNFQHPSFLVKSQDCVWPQRFRHAVARQKLCLVCSASPFSKALRGIPRPHDKRQQTVAQWPISKDAGILSKHPADCAHFENPPHTCI